MKVSKTEMFTKFAYEDWRTTSSMTNHLASLWFMDKINEIEFLYAYILKLCSHFTSLMHKVKLLKTSIFIFYASSCCHFWTLLLHFNSASCGVFKLGFKITNIKYLWPKIEQIHKKWQLNCCCLAKINCLYAKYTFFKKKPLI